MSDSAQINANTLKLKIQELAVYHQIPNPKAHAELDLFSQKIVGQLRCHIYANPLVDVNLEYPATWWDGFKLVYFPRFLLSRFPAKLDTFKIKALELATKLQVPEKYGPTPYMTIAKDFRYSVRD